MTHKEIVRRSHFSSRTIRYALKKLKDNKLLIEKMNMQDMRQIIYEHRSTLVQEDLSTRRGSECRGHHPQDN